MRRSVGLLAFALVLASAPAGAETIGSSSDRVCGQSTCASASASLDIDCRQVAADTVTCSGRTTHEGITGPSEGLVRLAGTATWERAGGCGWYLLGGPVHDCGWFQETETKSWNFGDFCCLQFFYTRDYDVVTYTSNAPFCLVFEMDSRSKLTVTTTVFGLRDYETVSASAGMGEITDIACASGGTP